jgi:uncharacterized SAM-binding protein YcdF (DUF218 family)
MNFILFKIAWVFLSPGNMLALALVAGAFLSVAHNEGRRKIGRSLCFTIALLFFLIGIFPVGSWLLLPLENSVPPQIPDHVAGIILLGGDEQPQGGAHAGRPVFLDSARRYVEFASLARRYPEAELLYSGGSPLFAPPADAKVSNLIKPILAGLGVPVQKMLFEETSRTTHENAVMSYKLAHPAPGQVWLLVTSAFHMPRALLTFQKAGWNVLPATTGYLTDGTFSTRLQFNLGEHLMYMAWAEHEYYGLLAYRLMGYTDRLWPG